MHTEISESFWLGVEVLATTVLLVITLAIGNSSRQLTDIMEQQQATEALLKTVREWSAYDDTTNLYEADVLSIYYKYGRNSVTAPRTITVTDGSTTYNIKGVDSTVALDAVRADTTYASHLTWDKTGVVTAVEFTAVTP